MRRSMICSAVCLVAVLISSSLFVTSSTARSYGLVDLIQYPAFFTVSPSGSLGDYELPPIYLRFRLNGEIVDLSSVARVEVRNNFFFNGCQHPYYKDATNLGSGLYEVSFIPLGTVAPWTAEPQYDPYWSILVFDSRGQLLDSWLSNVHGGIEIDIACPDLNSDQIVNLVDFSIFGQIYTEAGASGYYNPRADFNLDGALNLGDFSLFGRAFGAQCN